MGGLLVQCGPSLRIKDLGVVIFLNEQSWLNRALSRVYRCHESLNVAWFLAFLTCEVQMLQIYQNIIWKCDCLNSFHMYWVLWSLNELSFVCRRCLLFSFGGAAFHRCLFVSCNMSTSEIVKPALGFATLESAVQFGWFWSYGCLQPLPPTTDTHIRVYVQKERYFPGGLGEEGRVSSFQRLSPYQAGIHCRCRSRLVYAVALKLQRKALGEWVPAYCASYPFYLWKNPNRFLNVNICHKDQMKTIGEGIFPIYMWQKSNSFLNDVYYCLITREKTCFAQIRWAPFFVNITGFIQ